MSPRSKPRMAGTRAKAPRADKEVPVPALFQVLVQCRSEAEQRQVYEQMTRAGHPCRVLTM